VNGDEVFLSLKFINLNLYSNDTSCAKKKKKGKRKIHLYSKDMESNMQMKGQPCGQIKKKKERKAAFVCLLLLLLLVYPKQFYNYGIKKKG